MSRITIGVDPGVKGGICILEDGNIKELHRMPFIETKTKTKLPSGKFGTINLIDGGRVASILRPYKKAEIFIEQLRALHKASKSATFSLGRGLGVIEGAACAFYGEFYHIDAKVWQKDIWLPSEITYLTSEPTKIDTKATSFKAAQRIFPEQSFIPKGCRTPKDGLFDSALIAIYGDRYLQQQ